MEQLFTIKYVASHTQLSPHVIRAWERRYVAVQPTRTSTNRRLYSQSDIEKLHLLRQLIEQGHTISQIADRSIVELRELIVPSGANPTGIDAKPGLQADVCPVDILLGSCLRAIEDLDADKLDTALTRATTNLGTMTFLKQIALPLLAAVGDGWRMGTTRISREHMASAVLRTFLGRQLTASNPPQGAPTLLLTTPVGQVHEFGVLVAAIVAALQGWRALFIGPNLPADEIASAARHAKVRGIALSIVYPPDDPKLVHELWELRRMTGPEMAIIVGGCAAKSYQQTLHAIDALLIEDVAQLCDVLDNLRSNPILTNRIPNL